MFDHIGIAVADRGASEHFNRTVLSVLAAESSRTDARARWAHIAGALVRAREQVAG